MGSLSFDPVAASYDDTRGGERRGRYLAEVLRPWLPESGPVCELGVGTAVVAAAVAAGGTDVVGVDISTGMLRVATTRFSGPLARADATALPLRTGTLVAAYAVWVLHVVDDPGAVLAECARVLRPGGRLLAVVSDESRRIVHPALDGLERRYRRRKDSLEHLEPLAAAAGLTRRHVAELAAFNRPTAPNELAHHVERRTWSWLWELSPAEWEAEVEPAIAALRAEPEPDRPRPHQNAHLLVVWETARA